MIKTLKNVNVCVLSIPDKPGLTLAFLETGSGSICHFDGTSATDRFQDLINKIESAADTTRSLLQLGELVQSIGADHGEPQDGQVDEKVIKLRERVAEGEEILVALYRMADLAKMWDSEQAPVRALLPAPTVDAPSFGAANLGSLIKQELERRKSLAVDAQKVSPNPLPYPFAQLLENVRRSSASTVASSTPPKGYKLDPYCSCGECFIEIGGPEDLQDQLDAQSSDIQGTRGFPEGMPPGILQAFAQIFGGGTETHANSDSNLPTDLRSNVRRLH